MELVQPTTAFYDVSQVVRYLRATLEDDEQLQDLWVRGEVSQFTQAASGHWYFNLKDEEALLHCVAYRQSRGGMARLAAGKDILAHGRLTVYPQRGDVQLIVDQIEDVGVGALYQRFEQLKDELARMGLFDLDRKRSLPISPAVIGIVTSANAAALRDIIRTLRGRWPLARVVVAPTLVQGNDAPAGIVRALGWLNAQPDVEVVIIARGGGSIEDLWAFNDRAVALAIADSRIPTITGIGHETDFTIADFVADLRAATPTAAAVAISPDIMGLRALIMDARQRLITAAHDQLDAQRTAMDDMLHRLGREHPRERHLRARQDLTDATARLTGTLAHRMALERERLGGAALRLQSLSPLLTIARGYAAITRDHDGAAVTSVDQVVPFDDLTIRLRDGQVRATVTGRAANGSA